MELINTQQEPKMALFDRLQDEVLSNESLCTSLMYADSQRDVKPISDEADWDFTATFKESYGGEGRGSTYYSVIEFSDGDQVVNIRFDGNYQSHYGVDYESWTQVVPKDGACVVWVEDCSGCTTEFKQKLITLFTEDDSIPEELMEPYGDEPHELFTNEIVDSYGGEDQGVDYWTVRELTDPETGESHYVKFYGWYASHYGTTYDGFAFVERESRKCIKWEQV